jgi:uncharacterized protein YkwD
MFKSLIFRPTPLLVKFLFGIVITILGTGWSASSEASNTKSHLEITPEINIIARSQNNQELIDLAKLAHQQVNEYRSSLNLPALEFSVSISQQAIIHSQNMAQQTVAFSHDGFQSRLEAIKNHISYRSGAENVAYNMGYQDPVSTAVAGWIESDGHRQNMEGNYNLTGIGVAVNSEGEYYFTQIFILKN